MSSSKYKTSIHLGIKSSMRWSELKQDIMVWSSLKHMPRSVFWKSDIKRIGFSKLFMAKSPLKQFVIHSDQIHLRWQTALISELLFTALTDTADSLSFNTFAFFKNSIYGTKHFERKWLARSCFSNKAIICQLPCGHMTISPQPWGFRVVDTVKSLFLHSLIAIIGRLSLHTIFNSLWGEKLILECKCTCEINSNYSPMGFLNID